jgi:hypothetical protein
MKKLESIKVEALGLSMLGAADSRGRKYVSVLSFFEELGLSLDGRVAAFDSSLADELVTVEIQGAGVVTEEDVFPLEFLPTAFLCVPSYETECPEMVERIQRRCCVVLSGLALPN